MCYCIDHPICAVVWPSHHHEWESFLHVNPSQSGDDRSPFHGQCHKQWGPQTLPLWRFRALGITFDFNRLYGISYLCLYPIKSVKSLFFMVKSNCFTHVLAHGSCFFGLPSGIPVMISSRLKSHSISSSAAFPEAVWVRCGGCVHSKISRGFLFFRKKWKRTREKYVSCQLGFSPRSHASSLWIVVICQDVDKWDWGTRECPSNSSVL